MKEIRIKEFECSISKQYWLPFLRFIAQHKDFYQLLAMSEFIEVRLLQIKPEKVVLSERLSRKI